ncbi:hypothetical protein [Gordonia hydrophobica]|uniref:Uncharacterized protein n=1 Tax=Gordonia hydrophobica TaxID=40516 RepID=A0ABZ2TYD7_9ACTN|nr:hypothetical protein [Gordonia hydrophobica]MBM7366981.1 hypothetical protein [Gordonia hydrophobica]
MSPEQYRCARSQVGALMDEVPPGAHIALLMRFPALTIAGLVGHAALRSTEPGAGFWDGFWTAIGRARDKGFEQVVDQLLGDMLGQFGLRDVEGLRETSVLPLLDLHAGLDRETVVGLVAAVEQHVAAGHEPSGTALLDRVTEPGFAHRRAELPDAYWMLLQHAPAIAVNILSRITDLLVATVAHPEEWALEAITPTTADLPPAVLTAVIARLEEKPFLDGDAAQRLCTVGFPRLRCHAADGEIQVLIPGGEIDALWRLWNGEAPEQVSVPAGESAAAPIGVAVRESVLVDLDSGIRRVVPIFHPSDPIVVFGADGRALSRFESLPATELTVLVPRDVDLVAGSRAKVVVTDRRPAPWDGWEMRTVDLAGHRDLRTKRDGKMGRTRRVLPVETPLYALPEPLSGVTTRGGERVYGERPLVDLPAHEGVDAKEWRVRVRRAGQRDWLVDYPWAAADYVTSADPFDGLDEPLIGRYEIAAGDGYGLDLRLTVVLAEGLEAVHDPAVRLPQADGLTTSTTELAVSTDLEVSETELAFGPDDIARVATAGAGEVEVELSIRPPHAQIRFEHPGRPAVWRTELPQIAIEDAASARLTARIPGAVDVSFALLDADGDIVREWDAESHSGTEFAIGTRAVADAAKRMVRGSLVALIDDEHGESDEAEVATVVRTATAVEPNAVDHTGDELTAAWLLLDERPVAEIVLPDDEAGQAEPAAETAAGAAAESSTADQDDARGADEDGAAEDDADEEDAVEQLLVADPTASLLALGDSPVAPSRIPALMIRSGLAERVFEIPADYGRAHPNPYIGCTLATAVIVDPSAPGRDDVQSYLSTRGGDDLLRLIASGRMGDPRTGVFDANVLAVGAMGRDQVDALFERFRIVPGPLVDLDMRTAATIEAFHLREEWMADPVSQVAPRYVNKMLRDVRRASPQLYDLIVARNEALDGVDTITHPWMLLSMQSMAFAAIGRLQAYGRLKQPVLDARGRALWAKLADYCPAMVAADLLIANAVVVRADALDRSRNAE